MEKDTKRSITVWTDRGALTLEPQKVHFEGKQIHVTEFEDRLLGRLLERAGEYVSYADLTAHVYPLGKVADDYKVGSSSNVIEVLISRLRKKLPDLIQTKRFKGYRMNAEPINGTTHLRQAGRIEREFIKDSNAQGVQ